MKQAKRMQIRRSVVLSPELVSEAVELAPPDCKDNLNRLVVVSLKEFIQRRRQAEFDQSMADMAADPGIRYEVETVVEGLRHTDGDGLEKKR